jgi:hypothetical protein
MKTLLYFAAACQLGVLIASALVPRALNWRDNLATLNPFLRRLFWVYGSFIVLTIIGCSMLTFVNAAAMADGDPIARSICLFIAVFWAARLFVQLAVFDARPFLTNWFYKAGYHALTVTFIVLVGIYTAATLGSARVSRQHAFEVNESETHALPGIAKITPTVADDDTREEKP